MVFIAWIIPPLASGVLADSFVINQHKWEILPKWLPIKGLVTSYGEGRSTNGRGGGAREVLPLRKRGCGKSFSHAEGGHQYFWGSFYVVA